MESEASLSTDTFNLGITLIMILLNGFFVAAEFALVKLNQGKVNIMVKEEKPFASISLWIYERQNMALSACQLGITMASLALGWIGEPAVAHLITPLIHKIGFTSETLIHGIAFTIAFTLITSLHIIIGEQVPKIYAIRRPALVMTWTSFILKGFYIVLYPFMYVLNKITISILKLIGVDNAEDHDTPLSEEEIQATLSLSHASGELTKNEHRLLNAVFRFDDEVARHIMTPRGVVKFLDVNDPFQQNLQFLKDSNHSRFPLCEDSLDNVLGIIHIKDIIGYDKDDEVNLVDLARPPMFVPENMQITQLLKEFKAAKQHFAFVQDEHGTILGVVTMENVIEELVGPVQDEFDDEQPPFIEESENIFMVDGNVLIDHINHKFNTDIEAEDSDTLSGIIVEILGHKLKPGDKLKLLPSIEAEVVSTEGIRAKKVRLTFQDQDKPPLSTRAK